MLSLSQRPLISSVLSRKRIFASVSARAMSSLPSWATVDPASLGASKDTYHVPNLVDGQWTTHTKQALDIIHPLDKNRPPIFKICETQADEIQPFIDSLRKVSKSGLHNPIKNPQRYVQYGEISRLVSVACLVVCTVIVEDLEASTHARQLLLNFSLMAHWHA